MSMTEDLNLEGNWWIPDRPNEKRTGTLTFDKEHKEGVLSFSGFFNKRNENDEGNQYDVILGETNGLRVTLIQCLGKVEGNSQGWKSTFRAQRILLGDNFQSNEDIIFSKVYAMYSGEGVNQWIGASSMPGTHNYQARIVESYIITLFSKPITISLPKELQEQSSDNVLCFQIESLKEKCLPKYLELSMNVREFLNFIFPKKIIMKSLYGVRENENRSKENNSTITAEENHIKIIYSHASFEMFKPDLLPKPLFSLDNYDEYSSQIKFEKYMKKWFELSTKPVVILYCATMYEPDEYMDYLFLALATAIESYYNSFMKKKVEEFKSEKASRIDELTLKLSSSERSELKQIFDSIYHTPFKKIIRDVYEEFSYVTSSHFASTKEEKTPIEKENRFIKKAGDTRIYVAHGSKSNDLEPAEGDELVLLTKDLQFLVQLCIMTQLGFTKSDFMNLYHLNSV